mmetsp:Transcript_6785/g.22614  ORF Transcript_6785/g.22614 Transcript_6785/m.22614 type:complete len:214 (-) Transcript_6785:8-649(-)
MRSAGGLWAAPALRDGRPSQPRTSQRQRPRLGRGLRPADQQLDGGRGPARGTAPCGGRNTRRQDLPGGRRGQLQQGGGLRPAGWRVGGGGADADGTREFCSRGGRRAALCDWRPMCSFDGSVEHRGGLRPADGRVGCGRPHALGALRGQGSSPGRQDLRGGRPQRYHSSRHGRGLRPRRQRLVSSAADGHRSLGLGRGGARGQALRGGWRYCG